MQRAFMKFWGAAKCVEGTPVVSEPEKWSATDCPSYVESAIETARWWLLCHAQQRGVVG